MQQNDNREISRRKSERREKVNEITLYQTIGSGGMDAIERLGAAIAKSALFGITRPEQGVVVAATCVAERITPVEFAKTYHIMPAKGGGHTLSMKADAMLAKFMQAGGKVKWKRFDGKAAIADWSYGGGDWIEIGYAIEDAHRADLCGPDGTKRPAKGKRPAQEEDGAWQHNPDAMLRARCVSKAVRMLCPMVNAGIYTPEEVADFRSPPPEPLLRDVPATTVPDAPAAPPPTSPEVDALLEQNEPAVNAYLVKIGWLRDGRTWRDLSPGHRAKIDDRPEAFLGTAVGT
jgi:hypothetical protein